LGWPVPREKAVSAPHLIWPWEDNAGVSDLGGGGGEKEMRNILEGLRVGVARAVLMARSDEHQKICPTKEEEWKQVPWYGTKYKVVRFDEAFVKEVSAFLFVTVEPYVL
jgi:insulysin